MTNEDILIDGPSPVALWTIGTGSGASDIEVNETLPPSATVPIEPDRIRRWYKVHVKGPGSILRIQVDLAPTNSSAKVIDENENEAFLLLREVEKLDAARNYRAAGDLIFDRMDYLLSNDSEKLCDLILSKIETESFSTFSSFVLVAFLNITVAAKDKLPSRRSFATRARAAIVGMKGPEKANRILSGLE